MAWDPWLLEYADGLAGEGWTGEGIFQTYNQQNQRLGTRVLPWSVAMVGVTLLGIFLLPVVIVMWCRRPVLREARVHSLWGVSVVFAAFFGSMVAADQLYQYIWLGLSHLYVDWDRWQWNMVFVVADGLWRLTPVIIISLVLYSGPGQLCRSFRLRSSPALLSVAGCLGGLWLWHWVSYLWLGEGVLIDPTDFLGTASADWSTMLYVLVSSCVMAPVTEEIMYRGLLFLGLRRHVGPWAAMGISSVLFAVSHWQYDVPGMIAVGLMGLSSAVLVWRTGSLLPSIILHVVFNVLVTLSSYIDYQWPL